MRLGPNRRTTLNGAMFFGAAAVVTVLVAGCGSGGSSSSSAPASAATSASAPVVATSAAAPATSSAAPPASAPAVAGGTPACATRGLHAAVGTVQAAAGSIYQVIDFTNTSGASCTLFGYPGVSLAGGSPVTQIGAAASRSSAASAKTVTLAAGATASALLRITQAENYPTTKCSPMPASYLQIYPPNQTTPIFLAYRSTGCSLTAVKLLSIGVVEAGTAG